MRSAMHTVINLWNGSKSGVAMTLTLLTVEFKSSQQYE